MPSASELDAVTIDAFRTLVDLDDPVAALGDALGRHAVVRSPETVLRGFRAEVAYYLPRSHEGREGASLHALRTECARVFLEAADAPVEPADFVDDFVGSLAFRPLPGATDALTRLRGAGLALACVANWDASLPKFLTDAELAWRVDAIVSSAEVGAQKPDPRVFECALERLGVDAARTLHIGDSDADRLGADAAGLAFEPVPLATLPRRLGLDGP